ncbi:MAG: S8 family peptidase [Lachnospiraceae bacterium]|jgi:minor extracellular serine protease Vpr|nr:S8 family peptidase [Lachnospiraceae bacterium]
MENQKLEALLGLALSVEETQRQKSGQLGVGFLEETRKWELIVKYNGDIERLQSNVIGVEKLIAGYAIVTIPEEFIDTFTQLDEVEYVEKPKRLYFSTLQGKGVSCIFPVTNRYPYLSGKGTLVAVIDSGIDYTSPEFMTREGSTRIRFLWDQTLVPEQVNALLPQREEFSAWDKMAAPPAGFLTGVEFSGERINAALKSGVPELVVPSRDTSGHGTAVAAIGAAGGMLLEGQYQGVASESQLLVVKMGTPAPDSFPKTTELMRALTYVVQKAVELGMPVAVNLSFGNTYGSHDGTSLVERFLNNVSEIGRTVICVGSGNEGAAAGHVSGSFGMLSGLGDEREIELSVAAYQRTFSIQVWKEYVDSFRLRLRSPKGAEIVVDMNRPGGQSYVLENTEILTYVGEPSPYSVNQEIYFEFLPRFSYVDSGIWTIVMQPIQTVTGNYDLYLPSSVVLNEGTRFFTPTPVKTLTIPSTASKVITVGAYNAVFEAYADFSGRGYPMQNIPAERMIPGTVKPDLAAPGVDIETIGPGGTFVRVSGTSFATPFVTGSAALLMEWGERVTIWLS